MFLSGIFWGLFISPLRVFNSSLVAAVFTCTALIKLYTCRIMYRMCCVCCYKNDSNYSHLSISHWCTQCVLLWCMWLNDFIMTVTESHTHYFLCLLREKRTKGIIATQIISVPGQNQNQTLHCTNLLTLYVCVCVFVCGVHTVYVANVNWTLWPFPANMYHFN